MIPDAAVEAAAIALYPELREEWRVPPPPWESLDDDAKIDAIAMARLALEAAAPHMPAGGTGDREEVEERIKSIVQEVAMTVDYTERLYAAVQEIMAVTMPRPTQ